jgi:Tol biopolymer transport system component
VEVLVKDVGMRSFERIHPVILSDGKGVIMTGLAPGETVEDLLFVPLVGDRRMRALFRAPGVERNPAIAPNGRFIACNSDESGRGEVYVRPLSNPGTRKWQVSPDGGTGPVWTRNGRELVYLDSHSRMMAVAVRQNTDGECDFSKPEPLFTLEATDRGGLDRSWDVTADGERFVSVTNDGAASDIETSLELTLIHNWVDDLNRLVPPQRK